MREKKGRAETSDDLKRGLDGVADLIARYRQQDAALRAVMDASSLDAEYVAELRAAAEEVAATAKAAAAAAPATRVSQRALDLQDGTVIHLVNIIYRAFRDAHDLDETILLPRLGSLAALVDRARTPARPSTGPKTPEPGKPA